MRSAPRLAWLVVAVLATVAGGCSDFATEPTRTPSELRVTPDSAFLLTGEEGEFQIELLDESGAVYDALPGWVTPLWSSDRPDRIEFADGRVVPVRGGQSTLQVEVGGVTAEVKLLANPAELGMRVGMAYLTQSVQRRDGDVPLIAGRDALLRVIVLGDDENYYRPDVRATFYHGETAVHTTLMEVEGRGLTETVYEGRTQSSHDALIPAHVLQPGVGMVLEVDPTGAVPTAAGSQARVPESGRLTLDVREVPTFRLMMVPVTLAANDGRESRLDASYAAEQTALTSEIFPLGEIQVEVREPYVTEARMDTEDGWYQLIQEIDLLRTNDGNPHYYYGGFDRPPGTGIGGLGYVGYPVSIGMDDREDVIAHEIGHNLSLPHAPCGDPSGVDQNYPHEGGVTGAYGYQTSAGQLRRPSRYDLMTYCDPIWISDYNYERVIAYRDTSYFDAGLDMAGAAAALTAERGATLVVRGGVLNGRLRLEPALELEGPVSMPAGDGDYVLEGLDAGGAVLFSVPVAPRPLGHLKGAQFTVALPTAMARTDALDRLRLTGPEGVVERGRSQGRLGVAPAVRMGAGGGPPAAADRVQWDAGAFPVAVVRDRQTGRIRALSTSGRVTVPGGDTSRFEILLSDGVGTRPARVEKQ